MVFLLKLLNRAGLICSEDWVKMAKRYEKMPQVIGYDIRNEALKKPTQWGCFGV